MKKIVISFAIVLFGRIAFAQLTLQHTFNGLVSFSFEYISEDFQGYVLGNSNTSQIFIYNTNYSLYKTINVNLPAGYTLLSSITPLGKHIINTDNKIELICYATNNDNLASQNYNNYCKAYVVNEDGNILFDFGNSYNISSGTVHKAGNQLRLPILKTVFNGSVSSMIIEIYSCGGNYNPTSMISFPSKQNITNPYPNPSNTEITLPYILNDGEQSILKVYNINGQLIESFSIGSDFDKIILDVSHYPKGLYLYEYNGTSSKFVVH